MSQQEMTVGIIKRGIGMLRKHLADFSDADMLKRPVPAANHTAYQLAHLLRTTGQTLPALGATPVDLPQIVAGVKSESAKSERPEDFPLKDELLSLYEAQLNAVVAAVEKMSDAEVGKESPEHVRGFAPTLGALALMVPLHMTMHIGQMQVIRRSLGKPVLF